MLSVKVQPGYSGDPSMSKMLGLWVSHQGQQVACILKGVIEKACMMVLYCVLFKVTSVPPLIT